MDAIRIGKTEENGQPVIIVELFGVPLASSVHQVGAYDEDPEGFTKWWREYFARQIVSMLAEELHQGRRVTGWLMATRLSPRPPGLPTEGEEG